MTFRLIAATVALLSSAMVTNAGTVTVVNDFGVSSDLAGSFDVVENNGTFPGSDLNLYEVTNNTNATVIGFGVSAINSIAAWVGAQGETFDCNTDSGDFLCFESRVLYADTWLTETPLFMEETFQEIFGDFTLYATGLEDSINWYDGNDGAIFIDAHFDETFLWESVLLASSIIGLADTQSGTVAFSAGQATTPGVSPVPLPATGWLMLAGLGVLAAARRKRG